MLHCTGITKPWTPRAWLRPAFDGYVNLLRTALQHPKAPLALPDDMIVAALQQRTLRRAGFAALQRTTGIGYRIAGHLPHPIRSRIARAAAGLVSSR